MLNVPFVTTQPLELPSLSETLEALGASTAPPKSSSPIAQDSIIFQIMDSL